MLSSGRALLRLRVKRNEMGVPRLLSDVRRLPGPARLLGRALALGFALVVVAAPGAQQPPASPPQAPAPQGRPAPGQAPAAEPPAEGQPAPQQPVFRTGINFVRVDVIVTDKKGEPVADLQPGDFDVSEDGKPQTIETFKLVRVTGTPEPGAEAPRQIRTDYDEESEAQRDDVRIFVFLLDDYHVRRGGGLGVREPLVRFIQNQLGPLDMIAVMYPLTPVTLLRLTRNHDAIIREIQQFEGRKFDYRPRNEFEDKYSMYPAEIVERVRNEVSLSALEGLVTHLGSIREGRKSVILVSEGYSNYLPPQLRDPIADMPGLGNPNRGRPTLAEGGMAEDRARFFGDMDIYRILRDIYSAANRANTAIYALDPRGLAVFEYDINEGVGNVTDSRMLNQTMDTLRVLAEETDGRAIVNRNDLEMGLRQVVRDASAYYLIGYNSTQAPTDGKFHEIKVRVKRPGVQVRARKGYWALTAEETARAAAGPRPGPDPAVTNALAAVETPSRARVIRTWIGTRPAEDGKSQVSFVWEPVTGTAGQRREAPARVALIAAGAGGSMYYRGKVGPETAAPAGGTAAPNVSRGSRAEFTAAPGKVQLRVSVEDAAGNVIDSDAIDVTVPDYSAPEVQVTPLQVLRARNAVEFRALNADPTAMPVAGREFSRTERLLIRFETTGPGGQRPAAAARLLNRVGQPMSTLQPQPVPGTDGTRMQVDLPLAGLAAGDYIVEVTSGGEEGESGRARQFMGFRVVS
jgi:VWFA-related protein